MKPKSPTLVMVLVLLLAVPALGMMLAKVNRAVIDDKMVRDRLNLLPGQQKVSLMLGGYGLEGLVNDLVDEELLYQEGRKSVSADSEEYQERLKLAERGVILSLYIEDFLNKHNTPAYRHKYFNQHQDEYVVHKVRASHILLKTEEEAQKVLEQARAGSDFAGLARRYSADATAKDGGDLGYFERDEIIRPLGEIAFSMKKGEIRGPIKSIFGYHILKLTDIKRSKTPRYEDVEELVIRDCTRQLLADHKARLRRKAKIAVDREAIRKLARELGAD